MLTQVKHSLETLRKIAVENGLMPLPTASNFLTIDCGKDGAFATALMQSLIGKGFFVRMPGVSPLNRCIRITAGLPEELQILAETLSQSLEEVRKSF